MYKKPIFSHNEESQKNSKLESIICRKRILYRKNHAGSVRVNLVSKSSHEFASCGYRRSCFLGILHVLQLLNFHAPLPQGSLKPERMDLIETPSLRLTVTRSHPLNIGYLWNSAFFSYAVGGRFSHYSWARHWSMNVPERHCETFYCYFISADIYFLILFYFPWGHYFVLGHLSRIKNGFH